MRNLSSRVVSLLVVFSVGCSSAPVAPLTSQKGEWQNGYWEDEGHFENDRRPAKAAVYTPPAKKWALGAWLPTEKGAPKKVWVVMDGQNISGLAFSKIAPKGTTAIDTDAWVFPGLIDMHNHLKYNVLPLWGKAKAQFLNRFQWREWGEYKDAVAFNMAALKGADYGACAAVRYAELKALTGGVTSIQGVGGDGQCAEYFGVHNIEIVGEFQNTTKIRSVLDVMDPDTLKTTVLKGVLPIVKEKNLKGPGAYEEAFKEYLARQGVLSWQNEFASQPPTFESGEKLLFGPGKKHKFETPIGAEGFTAADRTYLAERYKEAKPALATEKIEALVESAEAWFFGGPDRGAYLKLAQLSPSERAGKSLDYLFDPAVVSIDSNLKRYLEMFERDIRQSVVRYLEAPGSLSLVSHLSEGRRGDRYNQLEYPLAVFFGYIRKPFAAIHGAGWTEKDIQDAASKKISVIWSPFSNLLLYGETLDVVSAKNAKLNIAIGSDWSPTGSKNLLDELKIARRYLNTLPNGASLFKDRDIVDMATVNGAKALGLENKLGKVEAGFQADLLFVKRKRTGKSAWSELLQAEQEDVSLVVISGEPVYGDLDALVKISDKFGENNAVEEISTSCRSQSKKGIRFPAISEMDKELEENKLNFRSVKGIKAYLADSFSAYAEQVKSGKVKGKAANLIAGADSIYRCEDAPYVQRFDEFIEKELPLNIKNRTDFSTNVLPPDLDTGKILKSF